MFPLSTYNQHTYSQKSTRDSGNGGGKGESVFGQLRSMASYGRKYFGRPGSIPSSIMFSQLFKEMFRIVLDIKFKYFEVIGQYLSSRIIWYKCFTLAFPARTTIIHLVYSAAQIGVSEKLWISFCVSTLTDQNMIRI